MNSNLQRNVFLPLPLTVTQTFSHSSSSHFCFIPLFYKKRQINILFSVIHCCKAILSTYIVILGEIIKIQCPRRYITLIVSFHIRMMRREEKFCNTRCTVFFTLWSSQREVKIKCISESVIT